MSRKDSKCIFKHQFVLKPRWISEDTITVPDLVLSMRDVYKKYVMTGNIEGLAVSPLVQDDRLMDEMPEETVDTLLHASQMREDALEELRTRQQSSANPAAEDKPLAEGVNKEPQAPAKPQNNVPDGDPDLFDSENE